MQLQRNLWKKIRSVVEFHADFEFEVWNSLEFRYRRYDDSPSQLYPGGKIWRPELDITISGPNGSNADLAILDTGSDQTVLPLSMASALGVALDETSRCDAANILHFFNQNILATARTIEQSGGLGIDR